MKTNLNLVSQKNWCKFIFLFIFLLISILPVETILDEKDTAGKDRKITTATNIKDIVSHTLNSFIGGFIENVNQKSVATEFFLQSNSLSIGFSQSSMQIVKLGQHPKVATLRFVGSNKVKPIGVKKLASSSNYFIGSNTSNWVSAHYYEQIVYKNIYNNIDLYYHLNDGKLKYEFYVYPGSNINDIQLQWSNSVEVKQIPNGMLINGKPDSFGNQFSFLDTNPINYNSNSRNQEIQGSFKIINSHTYGFNIPAYDKNSLLIIDPSIVDFGTYVSGSNNDQITSMVLDSSDNIYVTGYTTSLDFPTSSNAINTTTTDTLWSDAFLFKLSANGSTLLYSTYIVGSGNDYGESIVLDTTGNIYITGYTGSSDFPVTSNALNKTYNGGLNDVFVMKFSPNGSSLLYSTYLGGSGDDESVSIALDSQNNMYITGTTTSSINFPTKNAFNNTYGGGSEDGFVVKLNADGQALNYSTYLGGSSYDTPRSIKVDNSGYAYITGNTWSSDFPTLHGSYYASSDIFVTKMSLNGSQLIYSTLLSSSADSYGIAVDGSGNAYISGNSFFISYQNIIVYELAANGSTVLHSKSIDAGGNSYGLAISLDNYGNIYVGGYTQGDSLQTTSDAINSTGDTGYSDGVVLKLYSNFSVAYSTYFGGTGNDEITGIAPNSQGHIMVAGYTVATDFPVTAGSYNTTGDNASTNDGFIASINLHLETVPPDVVGPSNLTYESGTGHMLNWTVGDSYPGTYTVTRDGVVIGVAYNPWTNGTISINVDGLPVGIHQYNMTVYDGAGNSVNDTVFVTVIDTISPTISNPSNITYESGTTGNTIDWTAGDVHPDIYNITRNGTLVETNTWSNGTISYNIDNLPVGTYEFNITVYDGAGNTANSTVYVTVVDTTAPSVNGPLDEAYEFGSTGNVLNWTVGDVNPGVYNVTRNGTLVDTNTWSNGTISLNIDGLAVGVYEYNITVYDGSGNYIVNSVLVTVVSTTIPLVSSPSDVTYEVGSMGHNISWTVGDMSPGVYNITRNGTLVDANSWTNGTISWNIDGLPVGVYEYNISVYDSIGNVKVDTVLVTVVDTTPPTISSPLDTTYELGSTGHKISWTVGDIDPGVYNITKNGTLVDANNWTNGTISWNIDGLPVGVYEYNISVYDSKSNVKVDAVLITVVDTTSPTIIGITSLNYQFGSTGHNISWTIGDIDPGVYNVTRNGTLTTPDTPWINGTVSINVDNLAIGTYVYNITVYDATGNFVIGSIVVTVTNTPAPTVNGSMDIIYESGTTRHNISWTVSGFNPDVYNVTRNGTLVDTNTWTNGTIPLNVDDLPVGTYAYIITVYDGAGNSASSRILVTVVDTTTPSVSSPTDLIYESGTIGNTIDWTLGDVNPDVYNVTKNGTLFGLASNSWTNGTIPINIDNLPVGTYEFNITVYDAVGNFVVDSVIVTVVDTTAPSVSSPADLTYELGSTGNTIDWTVGDVNPGVYNVTKNGILSTSTTSWTNGTIKVNIDNLAIGTYLYIITVYDESGNYISGAVVVTVTDTTIPSVNNPSNITYKFGSTGHKLSWTVGDIDPNVYNVTVNGTLYTTTTQWTNGTISVNVDNLAIGVYKVTLFLYDKSGNVATNTVFVEVTGNSTNSSTPTSSTGVASTTNPSSMSMDTTTTGSTKNASFGGFLPVILGLISLGVLEQVISTRKKKN